MRRILHIDMDAFFASVEERRRPDLKGRPVVIGGSGDPTQRGVVSTASYEARKYGIHSAMPLMTAFKLCPQAVFLRVDYQEYERLSGTIKTILAQFSPSMEDVGIDEAFLDISGIDEPDEQIAHKIKQKIWQQTGLSCSIGISFNKLLAKMASDIQKPDGLTIITLQDIEGRIWPLAVRKLWGVGPKTEACLLKMKIHTIGDLASRSLNSLVTDFGKSYGKYLYEASHGIDENPLATHWEPKSISRETTFQTDTNDWQTIAKNLADLIRQTVDDLRKRGYSADNVAVKIRFCDFQTQTRAKTIAEPTDNLEALRRIAFLCLNRFELKKKVRLVGVRLSGLKSEETQELS